MILNRLEALNIFIRNCFEKNLQLQYQIKGFKQSLVGITHNLSYKGPFKFDKGQ